MRISYAICVCNESRDLFSLVSFLLKVKDEEDEINILIDTLHVTENVKNVIEYFGDKIVTCEKEFDGNFATRHQKVSKYIWYAVVLRKLGLCLESSKRVGMWVLNYES